MTNDRHLGRILRVSVLTVAVSLVAGACSGATTSVAPSPAASTAPAPTAAPTSAPTPSPTPSPTPVDASPAFIKAITAPDFSAVVTVSGTLTAGTVAGDIDGDGTISGKDSTSSLTISAGTFTQVTSSTKIGATSWSRKSPGPWLEDPKTTTPKVSFNDYLKRVGGLVDLGVVAHAGQQLHHLQTTGGNAIAPEDIGFDVDGATDGKFTIDFYAAEDGTPVTIAVTGTWTQVTGATSIPTEVAFEYAFSDVGKPQTVTPPDDVWVRYTSKALGYTMAHPPGWTVKSAKFTDTYLLRDTPFVYVAVGPYKGTTATLVETLKTSYTKDVGVPPTSETPTRLGGQPAVRLVFDTKNDAGDPVTLVDDITSRNGTGWEVYIATTGGAEDVATFDGFVATFEFTK